MSEFHPEALLQVIGSWPRARSYTVAFSGGLDSTVLLHGLQQVRQRLPGALSAIHVDHGLQAQSRAWEEQCRKTCRVWNVPYQACRVEGRPPRGSSSEDWARTRRYALLRARVEPGTMLLTAHQRDDQAETFILQLCRGAGPAGLAAMPAWRRFGAGWLGRPLLGWSRADLSRHAADLELSWIEDPSNADTAFDRNFARRQLLPLLRERWPGIDATLVRAAGLQAGTLSVLGEIAAQDLAACRGAAVNRLRLARLQAWPWPRQANVLRHWFGVLGLPPPAQIHLETLRQQLATIRPDAAMRVAWPGAEARSFAGELWAMEPLVPRAAQVPRTWCLREPCQLEHGRLTAHPARGHGLRRAALHDDVLEVDFRIGGESLRPAGDRHRRELRKLFQQARVPPWLRMRVPFLYVNGRLAGVAGLWVDEGFRAADADAGWVIAWEDGAAPGAPWRQPLS